MTRAPLKEIDISNDDILRGGITLVRIEPPKKSITLGYKYNFTLQDKDSLAGVLTSTSSTELLDLLNTLSTQFSKISGSNASVATMYPYAEDGDDTPTYIVSKFHALEEVNRRKDIRSKKRNIFRIKTVSTPLGLNVGDIINITYERYGFEAGELAIVISISQNPLSNRVVLEVWK
jgi:hypothetical protein